MKENAYLLNCRHHIVCALKATSEGTMMRVELAQALTELDAYRHGQLQKCDKCADLIEMDLFGDAIPPGLYIVRYTHTDGAGALAAFLRAGAGA
jgi:hypothetical protein